MFLFFNIAIFPSFLDCYQYCYHSYNYCDVGNISAQKLFSIYVAPILFSSTKSYIFMPRAKWMPKYSEIEMHFFWSPFIFCTLYIWFYGYENFSSYFSLLAISLYFLKKKRLLTPCIEVYKSFSFYVNFRHFFLF